MNPVLHALRNHIWFIAGLNSFPNPLSPEEEMKYIEQLKNGCETARNTLIERNLRLVAHIVKKYSVTNTDCDDLISIGTIGLIKAISSFDRSKGARLATYAARCIENAILSLWKHSATPTAALCSLYRFTVSFPLEIISLRC